MIWAVFFFFAETADAELFKVFNESELFYLDQINCECI